MTSWDLHFQKPISQYVKDMWKKVCERVRPCDDKGTRKEVIKVILKSVPLVYGSGNNKQGYTEDRINQPSLVMWGVLDNKPKLTHISSKSL